MDAHLGSLEMLDKLDLDDFEDLVQDIPEPPNGSNWHETEEVLEDGSTWSINSLLLQPDYSQYSFWPSQQTQPATTPDSDDINTEVFLDNCVTEFPTGCMLLTPSSRDTSSSLKTASHSTPFITYCSTSVHQACSGSSLFSDSHFSAFDDTSYPGSYEEKHSLRKIRTLTSIESEELMPTKLVPISAVEDIATSPLKLKPAGSSEGNKEFRRQEEGAELEDEERFRKLISDDDSCDMCPDANYTQANPVRLPSGSPEAAIMKEVKGPLRVKVTTALNKKSKMKRLKILKRLAQKGRMPLCTGSTPAREVANRGTGFDGGGPNLPPAAKGSTLSAAASGADTAPQINPSQKTIKQLEGITVPGPDITPGIRMRSASLKRGRTENDPDYSDVSNVTHESKRQKPGRHMRRLKSRARIPLPAPAVAIMRKWFEAHALHPFATKEEKIVLSKDTNLSFDQVDNWLSNARRRMPDVLEKARRRLEAPESDDAQSD